MRKIFLISGPCGSGKTTFADAYARDLVRQEHRPVYVIHGDNFHQGFTEPEDKPDFFTDGQPSDRVLWEDILKFNWDCILHTADRALLQGLDTVIDYVTEDELPRVRALADRYGAELYYIVLTADAEETERRIRQRGDTDLVERALFLKKKLEEMPENRGHLYDTTGQTPEDAVREIRPEQFRVRRADAREGTAPADGTVRKAETEDARTAAGLAAELWPHHGVDELAEEIRGSLAEKEYALFLYEEQGRAAGFAECRLRHDYVEGTESSPVGYLEGIYVKAGDRGRGIARRLLSACEDWAREQGCTEFASDCELDNTESQGFHRAVGFREANRLVAYTRKL